MKDKLTAVGMNIFMGGFTVGVKQAGYDVQAVLEHTNYGVHHFRLNYPTYPPVFVGEENWPAIDRPWLIYGNPPCAPWSHAGAKKNRPHYSEDPRVQMVKRMSEYGLRAKPQAWVWETVVPTINHGRPFVEETMAPWLDRGYGVTLVVHDTRWWLAQSRKRVFIVAHKFKFKPNVPKYAHERTVEEVLKEVDDPGYFKSLPLDWVEMVKRVPPGEALRRTWKKMYPGVSKNRPGFVKRKISKDRCDGCIMDIIVHHTELRFVGLNEFRVLFGYPKNWKLVNHHGFVNYFGRGVCPPVARWLAGQLRIWGNRNESVTAKLREVDLRKGRIDYGQTI